MWEVALTLENLQEVQMVQEDRMEVELEDLLTAVAEKSDHLDQDPVLYQGTFEAYLLNHLGTWKVAVAWED